MAARRRSTVWRQPVVSSYEPSGAVPVPAGVVPPAAAERSGPVWSYSPVWLKTTSTITSSPASWSVRTIVLHSRTCSPRSPGRVAGVGREPGDRVVAPQVAQAAGPEGAAVDEVVDREQLDGRHPEVEQVVDHGRVGQAEVGAAVRRTGRRGGGRSATARWPRRRPCRPSGSGAAGRRSSRRPGRRPPTRAPPGPSPTPGRRTGPPPSRRRRSTARAAGSSSSRLRVVLRAVDPEPVAVARSQPVGLRPTTTRSSRGADRPATRCPGRRARTARPARPSGPAPAARLRTRPSGPRSAQPPARSPCDPAQQPRPGPFDLVAEHPLEHRAPQSPPP